MIDYIYFLVRAVLSGNKSMQEGLEIIVAFRYFFLLEGNLPQDLLHEFTAV